MAALERLPEKVDAVIVGAGAAGCLFAATLAAAGKAVVVLEAGPAWRQGDLVSSQLYARRLRWGGPFVASGGEHPITYHFNAGWGFGGAALHHYGTWPRLHEEDFKVRSLHGRGLDWPIAYDDLRPYYDRIQEEVGIAGDEAAEVWRPPGAAYPMPPLRLFAQAKVIAKGFEALGLRTAPAPMAINSQDYAGRPACLYDGWCDAGCPIGALANPLVTYKLAAEDAGAHFIAGAYVTRLLPRSKTRAAGVSYVLDGAEKTQAADLVILAASVVHNPTILLNSACAAWPQGAANSSGAVGRYLMTHSLITIAGLFAEETEPHMGVTGAQLTCRDGYGKADRAQGFGSYQWLIAPAVKPNDLIGIATARAALYGEELDRFMRQAVRHYGGMLAMGEELPDPENRVALDARQGPGGTRLPRLHHRFSRDALGVWEHARQEGLGIFKAAGARDAWAGPLASAHLMGGTIMGDDPHASVADSFGRSHDIGNLVIAGPGLFPTGGAVNPNFTNHALALRSASHIIAHWRDYAD
ncbi:MAG: GMC oxidoreductase [Pseudomonadota bacterium]